MSMQQGAGTTGQALTDEELAMAMRASMMGAPANNMDALSGYPFGPTPTQATVPGLNMQPDTMGIIDPTYLAQLEILNRQLNPVVSFAPMGSGLLEEFGVLNPSGGLMVPARALPAPPPSSGGGGGFSGGFGGGFDSGGGGGDFGGFGGGGGGGGFDGTSSGPFGGISEGFDGSPSAPGANVGAQEGFDGSPGDGGGGGGGKIICTAMNNAYGFGSFRNAIWIAYADKHLTKAHEVGYHTLFLGLVDFGFKRGNGKLNTAVRKVMEWGTRHRSTDLRAEMRGTKRDSTGRIIRMIFEPLCYAVGKLKGY